MVLAVSLLIYALYHTRIAPSGPADDTANEGPPSRELWWVAVSLVILAGIFVIALRG